MVKKREAVAGLLLRLRTAGLMDHRLLTAFESIPRQNFVPVIHLDDAYAPGQMPIECGQSMPSADYVARILHAAQLDTSHRVLELGTGTGYQTALISLLCAKVTSLERFRTLIDKAKTRLENLAIDNAIIRLADGRDGDPDQGIFDCIIANCAYDEPPRDLFDQLTAQGVLIAPVGEPDGVQTVLRMTKVGSRFEVEKLFDVRMQPFIAGVSQVI